MFVGRDVELIIGCWLGSGQVGTGASCFNNMKIISVKRNEVSVEEEVKFML
jgi:hypothetical protein